MSPHRILCFHNGIWKENPVRRHFHLKKQTFSKNISLQATRLLLNTFSCVAAAKRNKASKKFYHFFNLKIHIRNLPKRTSIFHPHNVRLNERLHKEKIFFRTRIFKTCPKEIPSFGKELVHADIRFSAVNTHPS